MLLTYAYTIHVFSPTRLPSLPPSLPLPAPPSPPPPLSCRPMQSAVVERALPFIGIRKHQQTRALRRARFKRPASDQSTSMVEESGQEASQVSDAGSELSPVSVNHRQAKPTISNGVGMQLFRDVTGSHNNGFPQSATVSGCNCFGNCCARVGIKGPLHTQTKTPTCGNPSTNTPSKKAPFPNRTVACPWRRYTPSPPPARLRCKPG
jgi:hypothetical protein